MTQPILSQELLRALLHYNPNTGIFTWLARPPWRTSTSQAGTVGRCGGIRIMVNYKLYGAHRLAWLYITGDWPKDQIDHINHIRTDNRFINLREATGSQNQRNRSLGKNNTSGVFGVHWRKDLQKWQARIQKNNKQISLGAFVNKSDAIICRKKAEIEHNYHPNHGA